MHLSWLDLFVITVYMAVLALIGLHFSKRQTSKEEYFLGGRATHWLPAGGSILATLLSSVSYLNLPGEMVRYGVGFFLGLLPPPPLFVLALGAQPIGALGPNPKTLHSATQQPHGNAPTKPYFVRRPWRRKEPDHRDGASFPHPHPDIIRRRRC